tara:strand:- start:64 stop:507 length:444 start_codon:yes stop_codon:yes gene_type:complete
MFGHRYFGSRYFGPRYWGDGGSIPPTPTDEVAGGAGYPVNWQGKRRKLTLEEQPEKHLRHILDQVVAEYYGEIVEADVPNSVKAEAAKIVRPFVAKQAQGQRVPKVSAIDWAALQRDISAVSALVRVWSDEVAQEDDDDEILLMLMS